MASLIETYKSSNDLKYQTDLESVQELYKASKDYQEKYTFSEFANYAIQNSDTPIDKSLESIVKTSPTKLPTWARMQSPALSLMGDRSLDEVVSGVKSKLTKENFAKVLPFKEPRKVIGGVIEMLGTGNLDLVQDASSMFNTFGQRKVLQDLADKKGLELKEVERLVEKKGRETSKRAVNTILKPIVTLGTDDIYDGDTIQEPESLVGNLTKDLGSLLIAMRQPSKLLGKQPETILKPLRKNASKKSRKARNLLIAKNMTKKNVRRLGEVAFASQVVFEDNPDMQVAAEFFHNRLKNNNLDDNFVGDLLEYLDTDENSTAAQRRLSLLFDEAAFLGSLKLLGSTYKGGKFVSKAGINKTLETIKKDPKKVAALREYLIEPIQKVVPSFKSGVADDVFVATEDKGILKTPINFIRQMRRKFGTSRGVYSEELFNILKSSGYDKIAWSKEAETLFENLQYQIKTIAQTKKYSKPQIEAALGDYLAGNTKALNGMGKELKTFAKETRTKIDELGSQLTKNKNIPQELKNIIRLNFGQYLRQSYELFENPNYRPSEDVRNQAIKYVKNMLETAPSQKELFETGAKQPNFQTQAVDIVDGILNKGVQYKGIDTNIKTYFNDVFGAQNSNILFATREQIGEPLKKLMGARSAEQTSKSVFNTIETLGHYLTELKLYDDLAEKGKGKWFYDDVLDPTTVDNLANQRTAGIITGEGFGPLNGARTTTQIAKLFDKMNQVQSSSPWARVGQTLLAAKGWGQAAATVYSGITHARNTIGGGLIMLGNGLNPFDKDTRESFKILQNELFASRGKSVKELEKVYVKYQRLGLVNQSVQVSEFKRNINSAKYLDDFVQQQNETFSKLAYTTTSQALKNLTNKVSKLYVAEDDLWRIAAFEKELVVLKRANNLSDVKKSIPELETEAATIIRNTMPTYDLVPEGFQQLRAAPFGNFYSFFAERWRNNYHSISQGLKEIKSGNSELVERGYQRLASKITVGYAGSEGINNFSKYAFGVTDQEEAAIKDALVPYWSKTSTLGYQRDSKGRLQYVDLSFTNPDAPVLDVIRASLDVLLDPKTPASTTSEILASSIKEGLITFAKPFMTEALFTERLLEAYTGIDKDTGRPIKGFNKTNSSLENTMAIVYHVGEVLVPRVIREGYSMTVGAKAEKFKEGDLKFNEELMSKITGQRFTTVDAESIERSLYFKIREFNNIKDEIDRGLVFNKTDTTEQMYGKYIAQNKKYYEYQVDLYKALQGAKTLNLESSTVNTLIYKNLKDLNALEKMSISLGEGKFLPLRVPAYLLKKVFELDNRPNVSYSDFNSMYISSYEKLSHLPLIRKNNYTAVEQKALNELEKLEQGKDLRDLRFEGGEVQDKYPVQFVNKDPKDRESDYLGGANYQNQMDRLGFKNGTPEGTVRSNIKDALGYSSKFVQKLISRQKNNPDHDEVLDNFIRAHYNRYQRDYPEFSDLPYNSFKKNLLQLDKNVRYIESSNRNVKRGENLAGSSATGHYQFLQDSVQPAINRTIRRLPKDKHNLFDAVGETNDVSNLNLGNQQLLFLGDILEKEGSDKFVVPYMLGNDQAGKDLYLNLHHTLSSENENYNQKTLDRVKKEWEN